MFVNEIFQSIEGEGIRVGHLTTFIRLCGCNLRCSYCDTSYAFSRKGSREMTPEEILQECQNISIGNKITLTGGEPLIHEEVDSLIYLLKDNGFEINVETNGSVFPRIPSEQGKLFYTMDYKCPSSGESDKMSCVAIANLAPFDVLKFVVDSRKDLDAAQEVITYTGTRARIYLSPVFGKIEPREIVEYMQEYKMHDCAVQLQLHKFIWDPNKRGV